uniref:Uncharacterized protein n=1 Tax=Anguilla anguilla TaxID=7936 RepID=A0A0E9XJ68_ANGAN
MTWTNNEYVSERQMKSLKFTEKTEAHMKEF